MLQAGINELLELTTGSEQPSQPRPHRAWTPLARALAATGDRWTLMIVLALASDRMRLTGLQRRLPGVSTGVLERHVQRMVALGLVSRTRFKEMPPRVELELTDAGRELLPVAGVLARWGMRNHWSPPTAREQVDVGLLLRSLPALLEGQTRLPSGLVEVVLAGADPPLSHVYRVRRGRLLLTGRTQDTKVGRRHSGSRRAERREQASALVEGDEQAWIAALGPAGDCSRLRLTGDTQLAKSLFDALPR